MILSNEFLDEVKYYEVSSKSNPIDFGFKTVFVFHFKKWYKPRKVISIQWRCTDISGGESTYTESGEAVELKSQLYSYFKQRNA